MRDRDTQTYTRTYERGEIMTYDLAKADEIYKEHSLHNEHFDHHLVMSWREQMPEEFAKRMYEEEFGCHIYDSHFYEEAVSHFVNPDGSKGAHWSVATIKSKSGISNFEEKEYTCYDYAYVVNMLYSDYGNIFAEPSYYLRMAKNYLTDGDYYGDPSERAYCDAVERMHYFKK